MENEIKIECAHTELVDIDLIIPNPRNSNSHPFEQVESLKKAILFSGIRRPIVVSKQSGFIISGHCEYEALKQLGVKKAPVDYQEFKDELHERIEMAAHNLIARQSKLVTVELQELAVDLDQNNLSSELAGIPQNKVEILATQPPVWFNDLQSEINSQAWVPDPEKINKIKEEDSPIKTTITISCMIDEKNLLISKLKEFIIKEHFENVEINE